MKKLILTVALFCATISVKSQSRLGFTSSEIFSDVGAKYSITVDYTKDDGDKILNCEMGQIHISYCFFDKSNICNAVAITPNTQGALNYFVEQYNKNYVIISPTEWRMYGNDGSISAISLIDSEESRSYFLWVNAKQSN